MKTPPSLPSRQPPRDLGAPTPAESALIALILLRHGYRVPPLKPSPHRRRPW